MAPLLAHKSGVDRNFERLYRRHAVDVYRYALAVLRNQPDAEDVTQTTFMNAYRALERGEEPQTPHNWLIAIAHNVCRQRFRQASRRPLEIGLEEDVADQFVEPEDDNAPSPEDIRRALQHLAFNQRAALVMRELEGRSYAEIASLLDLSVSAVETLIFRARRALREQLEGALTCGQAEHAISRQLDGALPRAERSQLRAHLRECAACRKIARSQRAQRSALRGALGAVPLPSSLASLFGGGGAAVATKAAAVVLATGVATGVGFDVHHRLTPHATHHRTAPARITVSQESAPAPTAPSVAPVEATFVPRAQSTERAANAPTHVRQPRPATHPLTPAPAVTTTRRASPPVAVEDAPAVPAAAAAHGQGHGRGNGNEEAAGHAQRAQAQKNGNGTAKGRGHANANQPTSDASTSPQTPTAQGENAHGGVQGHGQGQARGNAGQASNGHDPPVTPPLVPPVTSLPVPTLPEPPLPVPGEDGDG
jgi:RNA polymerase sigma factor (sigma-70 family)